MHQQQNVISETIIVPDIICHDDDTIVVDESNTRTVGLRAGIVDLMARELETLTDVSGDEEDHSGHQMVQEMDIIPVLIQSL